jgi:hypothetical protein
VNIEFKLFEDCLSCYGTGKVNTESPDYHETDAICPQCKGTPGCQLTDLGDDIAQVVRHVLVQEGLISADRR